MQLKGVNRRLLKEGKPGVLRMHGVLEYGILSNLRHIIRTVVAVLKLESTIISLVIVMKEYVLEPQQNPKRRSVYQNSVGSRALRSKELILCGMQGYVVVFFASLPLFPTYVWNNRNLSQKDSLLLP